MTPVPGCSVWRLSDDAEACMKAHRARLDAKHQRPINEYEYALSAFGDCPFRHPCKYEFLILCWLHQWGDRFQFESEGIVNTWAIRMAKAFCYFDCLDIIGCGSSGKTAMAAAYVYTMWKANPMKTSVFLSTTTGEAAQSRTWGQIKDWHANDRYKIGKRIESLHLITLDQEVEDRDFRNSIKVVLIKPGAEGKNVMASIVGRKNKYVIWVCDEKPFMDIGINDASVNLCNNPFDQSIGLGNAPEEGDPMYLSAAPYGAKYPDGWRSVSREDSGWTTRTGYCMYFNGEKSPNFQSKSGLAFPLISNENFRRKMMIRAGGEDTPMYWKQFYGFPPMTEISDKVLTYKLLQSNGAFEKALWLDTQRKVLAGLDLGFRSGGDPCVLSFCSLGKNTDGRTVLEFEPDTVTLLPKQGSTDAFEVQIAKRVIDECRKRNCHDLALDVTGDGGILLQHIEREAREQTYKLNVTAVSFSGTADDQVVIPGESRAAKEMFANKVSQLWAGFRVSVLNKVICGMREHSNATTQLCGRKMSSDDRKRMTVEKKADMKKRLRRSPDDADASVLCAHLALKHGLSGIVVPPPPPRPVKDPFAPQYEAPKRYAGHATGRYGGR